MACRPQGPLNWSLLIRNDNASHSSFMAESDLFFHPPFRIHLASVCRQPHTLLVSGADVTDISVTCGDEQKCGLTPLPRTLHYHRGHLRIKSSQRTDAHTHMQWHAYKQHLIKGVRCCDLIPNLSSAVRFGIGLDRLDYGGKMESASEWESTDRRKERERGF